MTTSSNATAATPFILDESQYGHCAVSRADAEIAIAATLEPWANDPAAETEEMLVERAAFAAPRLRSIQYDRKAKGYAMSLDGEFVGYADTYHDAEVELDRQVFSDLTH